MLVPIKQFPPTWPAWGSTPSWAANETCSSYGNVVIRWGWIGRPLIPWIWSTGWWKIERIRMPWIAKKNMEVEFGIDIRRYVCVFIFIYIYTTSIYMYRCIDGSWKLGPLWAVSDLHSRKWIGMWSWPYSSVFMNALEHVPWGCQMVERF